MDRTIEQSAVLDFIRQLGVDPNCVKAVIVVPGQVSVHCYDRDEHGKLIVDPIKNDAVIYELRYKIVEPAHA